MEPKDITSEKIKKLLELVGKPSEFTVVQEGNTINVKITGQQDGALIGFRGKNLFALEKIISMMVNKDTSYENRVYVSIDVNEYNANRENQIKKDVSNIAKQVLESKKSYEMNSMNPRERKVVHDEINSMDGLQSQSVGDGENRRVIISVKEDVSDI